MNLHKHFLINIKLPLINLVRDCILHNKIYSDYHNKKWDTSGLKVFFMELSSPDKIAQLYHYNSKYIDRNLKIAIDGRDT